MVTSLFRRSAIVVHSQSLSPASSRRQRPGWFRRSHGQPCAWTRQHLEEFCVSSAVIGNCVGLMSASVPMRERKVSRWRFLKGASEVGRVSDRTRFKRSSRSLRARSPALCSIAPDVVLECSSSDVET